MEILSDLNRYYEASRRAEKGSSWKRETQKFENDFLDEIITLKNEVMAHTYEITKGTSFLLKERGKERWVNGKVTRDRTVGHLICDDILLKRIEPYLAYDNGASQKGRGISFVRENFENDLHGFYLEHGDNRGYVVLADFTKFYDNILHSIVREQVAPFLETETEEWLFDVILRNFEVDVSYMTDGEYAACLDEVFDSIEYQRARHPEKGGKMMAKSVDIGDQVSQVIGIFYPTPYDNFLKTVKGYKRKHRYMDDTAIIVRTYGEALQAVEDIREGSKPLGMFLNEKKTRICPIWKTFTFLQRKYFLSDSGQVVKRLKSEAVTRERRRIKGYGGLEEKGRMPREDIRNSVKSWMGTNKNIASRAQREEIAKLYKSTFKEELQWKKSKSRSRKGRSKRS